MNALTTAAANQLQAQQGITADLFNRFINYIDGSPKTVETYRRALKQFITWLQAAGITQPARSDILAYREQLKATHKPSTTQAYITAVRLFFAWLEQEGLYNNIADHIKGAKLDREHKKDALTTAQIKDILNSIDTKDTQGRRDYAILALAVTGGLRTIELQRANIGDIRAAGDNTVLYIQGKGREEKTEYIKLPAPVEKAIRAYLKARGKAPATDPLFTSASDRNNGGRLTTKSISRLIKSRFIAAGYNSEMLTAHSLRHTAGTLNLLNGGSLEETQQLLRHSNINTTMIYLHHIDRAKNQSEERIAGAIF
ncbi:MAG TPA: tyrosine-type recombinase/integrase [Candidatus Cloacimonas sp.]|nr:tyrosine-type recombinase/integrase [Candidatus Cloacimonas sp.]